MSYNDPDMSPGPERGRGGRGFGGWNARGRGRGAGGGPDWSSPFSAPYTPAQPSPGGGRFAPYNQGQAPRGNFHGSGNRGNFAPYRGGPRGGGQFSRGGPPAGSWGDRGNQRGRGNWGPPPGGFRGNSSGGYRGGRGGTSHVTQSSDSFNPKDYVMPRMTQNPWAKLEEQYRKELEDEERQKNQSTSQEVTVV